MGTQWSGSDAPRGEDYDARWAQLAATGASIHGEADLVDALLREGGGRRVLDAGCGTGRVAIELARRGYDVVGVDLDATMLDTARAKAPDLAWIRADLARLDEVPAFRPEWTPDHRPFDAVVLAGNVMIFLAVGTEATVLAQLSAQLIAGGLLIAGFQLRGDRLTLEEYDDLAARAGLALMARWSTWDREPFAPGGDYAVSVHVRPRD